ncbi:uncharacterized protein LOC121429490 [Lytechinus variegatus]|uniref:uncharacterized protein LOC121429490 n=1 Tax=Lytechinus variegatus TaxID=7654 RepID=UPI001BB1C04A|nr:uncharacterized protein LOC121429490 [Lytechinus variegatus]
MNGAALWEAGYRNLYGFDMSETSLKVAREKRVYSHLFLGTIGPETSLDYETGYFDLVFSTGCFIPNHLNESHIPEMIRLVKKGGYLVIVTRKIEFEREEGDLKLKSSLRKMVEDGILKKISHEDVTYKIDKNMPGITLCYRVN